MGVLNSVYDAIMICLFGFSERGELSVTAYTVTSSSPTSNPHETGTFSHTRYWGWVSRARHRVIRAKHLDHHKPCCRNITSCAHDTEDNIVVWYDGTLV